ncbi:MAG: DUF1266 domain-containing protein [Treponema sp.]|jgi:hypothetical protein|nr:DUF1266 domain-containing protein [Treponema sp.]
MKQRFLCLLLLAGIRVCLFADLTEERRWAIALTGIMTEINNDSHDTLNFGAINGVNKRKYLEILRRDWSITTREELLETITVMELNGHASSLAFVKKIIGENKDLSFNSIFNKFQLSSRQYNYLKFTIANWGHYYGRTILAWDLGRNIALCRWGYDAGFLTEDEAWEKIMYYARKIQPLYNSWAEYGLDYYFGRIFWASGFGAEMDYFLKTDDVYRKLMDQGGYWNSLEWKVNLDP